MSTFADLEKCYEDLVNGSRKLLPAGTVAKARLLHEDGRKARSTGSVERNFTDAYKVEIYFEQVVQDDLLGGTRHYGPLLRALYALEQEGTQDYVVFTWFRNKYIPQLDAFRGVALDEIQTSLSNLIQDGCILTDKVPNPKNPSIPVTTIRVNRSHREVQKVTGVNAGKVSGSNQRLFKMAGPPLSQTIVNSRR